MNDEEIDKEMTRIDNLSMSSDQLKEEEAWLKKIFDDSLKTAEHGTEGDIPIPEGFGMKKDFWIMFTLSGLFGLLLGILGLIFLNVVEEVS